MTLFLNENVELRSSNHLLNLNICTRESHVRTYSAKIYIHVCKAKFELAMRTMYGVLATGNVSHRKLESMKNQCN